MTDSPSPTAAAQPTHIRSFVRRQGRITPAQRKALEEGLPRFSVDPSQPLDPVRIFGRAAPLFVEIGFGNGETLAQLAATQPGHDFLGIEVHPPGVGHLLLELQRRPLSNVRVCTHDAVEVLEHCISDTSLAGIFVFFPDPWHKKRHHKRRLINPAFVTLAAAKLRPGGILHLATDWDDYALQMREVCDACAQFDHTRTPRGFSERPDYRPETKFERRGRRLGHQVWDLLYRRAQAVGPLSTPTVAAAGSL